MQLYREGVWSQFFFSSFYSTLGGCNKFFRVFSSNGGVFSVCGFFNSALQSFHIQGIDHIKMHNIKQETARKAEGRSALFLMRYTQVIEMSALDQLKTIMNYINIFVECFHYQQNCYVSPLKLSQQCDNGPLIVLKDFNCFE